MYRMDEHTFKKLAEMLRPILERNEYYASEKRKRESKNRRVTENFVSVSCGTAVQLEHHEKTRNIFCGTAVQLD